MSTICCIDEPDRLLHAVGGTVHYLIVTRRLNVMLTNNVSDVPVSNSFKTADHAGDCREHCFLGSRCLVHHTDHHDVIVLTVLQCLQRCISAADGMLRYVVMKLS